MINISCKNSDDLLKYAIDNGIIDLSSLQDKVNMSKRQELLSKHKYQIWLGDDGRWRTYLPDETKSNGRRLTSRNSKTKIEDLIVDYYQNNDEELIKKKQALNVTLLELFPQWLNFKQLHTDSTSYTKRITADWQKFYASNPEFINKPIAKMDKLYFDEWIHTMIKKYQLTKKAYYNMTVIIRQSLDYAVELGYIKENIFREVEVNKKLFRHVKKKTGVTEVYTESEEERFIKDMFRRFENNPKSTSPLAVILAFEIGVRIGELCVLKKTDIEGHYIQIQRQEVRDFERVDEYTMKFKCFRVVEYTKSEDGYRAIYLTEAARKIIALVEYMNMINNEYNPEGYLFVKDGKNIDHYSIQAMIRRGCQHVNMDTKTCHKIRKTYISTLIDSGLNIDEIRRMAGHADERTTYGNYCYNRLTNKQTELTIEGALDKQNRITSNQYFELANII